MKKIITGMIDFWGVNKSDAKEEGIGENNLGKLLMEIRNNLMKEEI